MSEKMADYYTFLKDQIYSYKGKLDDYLYYLPEFFNMLCNLLNEDVLSRQERNEILAVLGYFVLPQDVIPESIYGPAGFVDDLFLCCFVLNGVLQKHGAALLEKYWTDGNEMAADALTYTFKETMKKLDDKVNSILDFVGFK